MTEELVSFPTAKLAKQKGFSWKCREAIEWYEFKGKEYGPTLITQEMSEIHSYPPNERALLQEEMDKLLRFRKMFMDHGFNNASLPPYLYARPTQDLLEKWLREKHKMWLKHHCFEPWQDTLKRYNNPQQYAFELYRITGQRLSMDMPLATRYNTFEEAREAILLYALKLIPDA